jgi:hypothetical protein
MQWFYGVVHSGAECHARTFSGGEVVLTSKLHASSSASLARRASPDTKGN